MQLLFDISSWNIFTNYELLGERTVGGFMRASNGSWADKLFGTHWKETQELGLLRGAYHFWRPDQKAQIQAQTFFDAVRGTGDLGELPPVLDVEMFGKAGDVLACLQEIERLFGKRPLIYTAQGIWNSLGNISWAKNYPLWVANYLFESEGAIRWDDDPLALAAQKTPSVPTGWKNTGWTFWQFTARGHGPDFGQDWTQSKQIDLNVYRGTLTDLKAWAGITDDDQTPPKSEDPWDAEKLPSVGRKVRVLALALNLRNAPIVLEGNRKDVMNQGDQTVITNVRKDKNYIWCETGYRQWFAYKRRDGRQFAEEI